LGGLLEAEYPDITIADWGFTIAENCPLKAEYALVICSGVYYMSG